MASNVEEDSKLATTDQCHMDYGIREQGRRIAGWVDTDYWLCCWIWGIDKQLLLTSYTGYNYLSMQDSVLTMPRACGPNGILCWVHSMSNFTQQFQYIAVSADIWCCLQLSYRVTQLHKTFTRIHLNIHSAELNAGHIKLWWYHFISIKLKSFTKSTDSNRYIHFSN